MRNQITSLEKKISVKDIEVVESTLKSPLPKVLVDFYLQYNGCEINKCIKTEDGEIISIECFFPIKYNSEFNDDPDFTAEGETLKLQEASVIPSNIFIFGMESENEGRIAVDLNCKSVYLYPIIGMKKDIFIFDTPVLITKSIEYFFTANQISTQWRSDHRGNIKDVMEPGYDFKKPASFRHRFRQQPLCSS